MLIDLDLGKERGSERSGARFRTGTLQFMAIDVLNGLPHTYRHDLEFFFYVFSGYASDEAGSVILRQISPRAPY